MRSCNFGPCLSPQTHSARLILTMSKQLSHNDQVVLHLQHSPGTCSPLPPSWFLLLPPTHSSDPYVSVQCMLINKTFPNSTDWLRAH